MKDKEVYYKLGLRIKEARLNKNLTQAQLAELVNISEKHIGNVERGEKNIGQIKHLINIMNALEISPNQLFCDYVDTADSVLKNEFNELLEGCSSEEIITITKISKVVKDQFREYIPNNK